MTTPDLDQLLKQAIACVNADQLTEGRALLEEVLKRNPKNDRAWVWLSGCVEDPRQRRICLQQALLANPNNRAAQDGMKVLDGELVQATAPSLLESRMAAIGLAGDTLVSTRPSAPTTAPPPPSMPGPPAGAPSATAAFAPDAGDTLVSHQPFMPAEDEGVAAPPARRPRTLLLIVAIIVLILLVGMLIVSGRLPIL